MAEIPIFRFFLPYTLGLAISIECEFLRQLFSISLILVLTSSLCLVITHSSRKLKYRKRNNAYTSLLIFISFLSAGMCLGSAQFGKSSVTATPEQEVSFKVVRDISGSGDQKIIGRIIGAEHDPKLLGLKLAVFNRSGQRLQQDDLVWAQVKIWNIQPPLNKYEFNSRTYYGSMGVFHKTTLYNFKALHTEQKDLSLFSSIAGYLNKAIKQSFNPTHSGFLMALVLGDRSELDEQVKHEFIRTGSMHVLAVSGLHVGAFYLIILGLFNLFKIEHKGIRFVVTIVLVWSYALLTGLGEPVQRAALMLSMFSFSRVIQRRPNGLNTLFSCALILMIIDPLVFTSVSFRFSFVAVLSILLFYDRIDQLIKSPNFIFRKIWSLMSLGISAQILTLPLSLYYFNQFSFLFLFSGILVVPYVVLTFYLALIWMPLSILSGALTTCLRNVISVILDFTIEINSQLAGLNFGFIDSWSMNVRQVMVYYVLLLLIILYVKNGSKFSLYTLLFVMTLELLFYKYESSEKLIYMSSESESVLLKGKSEAYFIWSKGNEKRMFPLYELQNILRKENQEIQQLMILHPDLLKLPGNFSGLNVLGHGYVVWGNKVRYFFDP